MGSYAHLSPPPHPRCLQPGGWVGGEMCIRLHFSGCHNLISWIIRPYAHFTPPPPHPRPGCKHQTNPAPPTTAPAIPSSSHTCQGSSRESLIIASDGSALWGLLVYVTSYVGSCKFMSAQCCSLSTPAVLLHVWLLRMGEDTPHISVLRPLGCCAHQWSCKFARRCN